MFVRQAFIELGRATGGATGGGSDPTAAIGAHNTSGSAHADIRALVDNLEFVKDVVYDSSTGDVMFTYRNNSTLTLNLFIASLVEGLDYDPLAKQLVITKKDGTEIRVSVSDLVDIYTGFDGTHIQTTVASGNVIQAVLKAGSVTSVELSTALMALINSKIDASGLASALASALADYVKKESGLPQELDTSLVFAEDNALSFTDRDSIKRKGLSLGEYDDNRILFSDVVEGFDFSGKRIVFDTTKNMQNRISSQTAFILGSEASLFFDSSMLEIYIRYTPGGGGQTIDYVYQAGSWLMESYRFPAGLPLLSSIVNFGSGFAQDDPYLKLSDIYICDVDESIEVGDVAKHLRLQTCNTVDYDDHITVKTPSGVKELAYTGDIPESYIEPDDMSHIFCETSVKKLQDLNEGDFVEAIDFNSLIPVDGSSEFSNGVVSFNITFENGFSILITNNIRFFDTITHLLIQSDTWAITHCEINSKVSSITGNWSDYSSNGFYDLADVSLKKCWDNEQLLEEMRKKGVITSPDESIKHEVFLPQAAYDALITAGTFDSNTVYHTPEPQPSPSPAPQPSPVQSPAAYPRFLPDFGNQGATVNHGAMDVSDGEITWTVPESGYYRFGVYNNVDDPHKFFATLSVNGGVAVYVQKDLSHTDSQIVEVKEGDTCMFHVTIGQIEGFWYRFVPIRVEMRNI